MAKLLTPSDVEEQYGIPAETLRWRRANGTGPKWFKLPGGRLIYYALEDVEAWLDEARNAGNAS